MNSEAIEADISVKETETFKKTLFRFEGQDVDIRVSYTNKLNVLK